MELVPSRQWRDGTIYVCIHVEKKHNLYCLITDWSFHC